MPVAPVLQLNKYKLKYDGANVTTVLTAIKDAVMVPRYQAAVTQITQDRETVRTLLEGMGVDPGLHGIHYAFGFAVSSAKFSHSGAVLQRTVSALRARFLALGGIADVLDAIAEALTGYTPYY
jgi:hypothetical protein